MKGLSRKTAIIISGAVAVVVLGAAILLFTVLKKEGAGVQYEFGEVTRGDLESVVTATGTLSAVGTVEVGTQVSGRLAEIFVDFNDKVHKGQIVAVLDTTLLEAAVKDAEASLMSAKAQYDQAKSEYDRNLPLSEKGYLSEQEFLPIRIAVQIREASLKSAEAALDRAMANLRYAVIRSPIDGTIIQRNNEPGQTVAASLSAPTLFIVAENLSDMQILASVDETDIGQIKEGQPVRFTVQANPDQMFEGTVSQVRLQPQTVQNVVNYTVVIDTKNDKGLLLPGMTATVDFLIAQRKGVLLVPNAALRLVPTKEMFAEVRGSAQRRGNTSQDSSKGDRLARGSGSQGVAQSAGMTGQSDGSPPNSHKMIWFVDSGGRLKMETVQTGITSGRLTELVSAGDLHEGMKIITSLGQSASTSTSGGSQPGGPRMRLF
ncbi:MAG: efflux RND transporter periplasmic adaptor subunit [Candidatus Eisenbacteria bacterium]